MNIETRRDFILNTAKKAAAGLFVLTLPILACSNETKEKEITGFIKEWSQPNGTKKIIVLPGGEKHPELGGTFALWLPEGFFATNKTDRTEASIENLVHLGVMITPDILAFFGETKIPTKEPEKWELHTPLKDIENFAGPHIYSIEWDKTGKVKTIKWDEHVIQLNGNMPSPTRTSI